MITASLLYTTKSDARRCHDIMLLSMAAITDERTYVVLAYTNIRKDSYIAMVAGVIVIVTPYWRHCLTIWRRHTIAVTAPWRERAIDEERKTAIDADTTSRGHTAVIASKAMPLDEEH